MKRKTKRFGKGGNIAGALAAGLLGYAMGRGKGEDKDSSSTTEDYEKPTLSAEDRAAKLEAGKRNFRAAYEDKELPKQGKFPYEAGDETSGPAPSELAVKKPITRQPVAPKKATTATPTTKSQPSAVNIPSYEEAKRGRTIERQVMGVDSKSGTGPKNTFLTKERTEKANKAMGNAWRSQNPNLSKSQDEKYKDYQKRNEDYKKMLEGFKNKKSGGAVKKYAAGGSVSSASKRADGIAQRGKTRGKVC